MSSGLHTQGTIELPKCDNCEQNRKLVNEAMQMIGVIKSTMISLEERLQSISHIGEVKFIQPTATFGSINNFMVPTSRIQKDNGENVFDLLGAQKNVQSRSISSGNLTISKAHSMQIDSLDKLNYDLREVLNVATLPPNNISINYENAEKLYTEENEAFENIVLDEADADINNDLFCDPKLNEKGEKAIEDDEINSIEIVFDCEDNKSTISVSTISNISNLNVKPYSKFLQALDKKSLRLIDLRQTGCLNPQLSTQSRTNELRTDTNSRIKNLKGSSKEAGNAALSSNNIDYSNDKVLLDLNCISDFKVLGKKKLKGFH